MLQRPYITALNRPQLVPADPPSSLEITRDPPSSVYTRRHIYTYIHAVPDSAIRGAGVTVGLSERTREFSKPIPPLGLSSASFDPCVISSLYQMSGLFTCWRCCSRKIIRLIIVFITVKSSPMYLANTNDQSTVPSLQNSPRQ